MEFTVTLASGQIVQLNQDDLWTLALDVGLGREAHPLSVSRNAAWMSSEYMFQFWSRARLYSALIEEDVVITCDLRHAENQYRLAVGLEEGEEMIAAALEYVVESQNEIWDALYPSSI